MKTTLRTLLIGAAGGASLAVLPLGAATSNSGTAPAAAPSSDTVPPAPTPASPNTSTPNSRNDVQPAPAGAPSSDTQPASHH